MSFQPDTPFFRYIYSTYISAFAWQLMTPTLGGTISQSFLSRYDATVQAALNSGSDVHVIIDLVCSLPPLRNGRVSFNDIAQLRALEWRDNQPRRAN